ncbi:tripartite tricarboxylate transporter permease [Shimia biformata]|uniref:tripartite tricarboxylate transporter permease n=1 Tax=Shimia biformata TaxID=1294299 RepID=UPI00194FA21A|nr:tripartite tricarboxylate transporter permease [Shimia biformata]
MTDLGAIDYVWLGVQAVFLGPEAFVLFGIPVSITLLMVAFGLVLGIVVGATPGLGGVIAMAISLPILISVFGFNSDALLPVMGFLIGVMKGSTVGGAVPAILFNTPGTPDAFMTTLDGYPMARSGKARKALKIAHFSSVSGDTFSDIVLIVCAPFLAIMVEAYLDLPEKTALLILSLSFIAAVVGGSAAKGLLSCGLGLLAVYIGSGEDFYPRLSLGTDALSDGIPVTAAVIGILVLGAIFTELEDLWHQARESGRIEVARDEGDQRLHWADIRRILPFVGRSAFIGTAIGALPGIGSTLAATIGYATGKRFYARRKAPDAPEFGEGAPEGIAATEAANSSVSGANLIPVLSLGIPGNTAAVFLILAAESIGGFNPGPSVFKFSTDLNPELVIAFGLFTTMILANLLNWTVGGVFMRSLGVLVRIPKQYLLPVVLLLTLASLYVEETSMSAIWFAFGFGVLGYFMRRFEISPLPFVIAFVLGGRLEDTARQAFSATGGDPFFLLKSPVAAAFVLGAVAIVFLSLRKPKAAQS